MSLGTNRKALRIFLPSSLYKSLIYMTSRYAEIAVLGGKAALWRNRRGGDLCGPVPLSLEACVKQGGMFLWMVVEIQRCVTMCDLGQIKCNQKCFLMLCTHMIVVPLFQGSTDQHAELVLLYHSYTSENRTFFTWHVENHSGANCDNIESHALYS